MVRGTSARLSGIPTRSCLACRCTAEKRDLVRLVARDGAVVVDPQGTLDGRGAYLCGRPECLGLAVRRGGAALHRALRTPPGRLVVDEERVREGWNRGRSVVPAGVGGESA